MCERSANTCIPIGRFDHQRDNSYKQSGGYQFKDHMSSWYTPYRQSPLHDVRDQGLAEPTLSPHHERLSQYLLTNTQRSEAIISIARKLTGLLEATKYAVQSTLHTSVLFLLAFPPIRLPEFVLLRKAFLDLKVGKPLVDLGPVRTSVASVKPYFLSQILHDEWWILSEVDQTRKRYLQSSSCSTERTGEHATR